MSELNQPQMARAYAIQRELHSLEQQQKKLIQELYSIIGIQSDCSTRKTSKNRLTPDMARRLCGC